MFDIIRKAEYFEWTTPKIAASSRYSLVPSHYSLKGIQDAWIMFLLERKRDLKIAEVGGGKSRILEALSKHNECWNIDKFEGLGAGPLEIPELPGVKIARSYMGDFDSGIPDDYFDVVFSISVIEHVPKKQLDACFADCYRILKPGGLLLHAIDLYISDEPTYLTETVELYHQAISKQNFEWLEEPAINNRITFRCDYASNSDLTMSQWNRIAPSLRSVRENHQSVSIKLVAIKKGDRTLTERLLAAESEQFESQLSTPPSGLQTSPPAEISDNSVKSKQAVELQSVNSSAQSSSSQALPTPVGNSPVDNSETPNSEPERLDSTPTSPGSDMVVDAEPGSSQQRQGTPQRPQQNVLELELPESIRSDAEWVEAITFVRQYLKPRERVLAPVRLSSVFPKFSPYKKASKRPLEKYRWILVHKGQLDALEGLLHQIIETFKPVFANLVFVVFSNRSDVNSLPADSFHLTALSDSLRPKKSFPARAIGKLSRTFGLRQADKAVSSPSSFSISSTNRPDLVEQAKKMRWFHAIDFGDFQSSGRFGAGQRQNITLFPVFELIRGITVSNMECLDVGAACGLVSFGLRSLGAKRVVAADIVDFQTFRLSNTLLGVEVEYYPFTRADQVSDKFPNQQFDLVVCAGVLYHMFNPMGAIAEARLLLRKNGLFVIETAYDPRRKEPVMELNSESERPFKEAYTYWNISELAIAGMLKLCGFNILRRVKLKAPSRIAFLAQAVDYNVIDDRTDLTKRMHDLGFGEQKYIACQYPTTVSLIQFDSTLSDSVIDIETYQTNFPHHVDYPKSGAGSSLYNPKQGNF